MARSELERAVEGVRWLGRQQVALVVLRDRSIYYGHKRPPRPPVRRVALSQCPAASWWRVQAQNQERCGRGVGRSSSGRTTIEGARGAGAPGQRTRPLVARRSLVGWIEGGLQHITFESHASQTFFVARTEPKSAAPFSCLPLHYLQRDEEERAASDRSIDWKRIRPIVVVIITCPWRALNNKGTAAGAPGRRPSRRRGPPPSRASATSVRAQAAAVVAAARVPRPWTGSCRPSRRVAHHVPRRPMRRESRGEPDGTGEKEPVCRPSIDWT